jgi:predicted GNAT family acetyltransferase
MLTIKHRESERNGLFEAWLDDVHVGELTYQRPTSERMIIDHTRVFEGFEWQGIARQLVMAAVDFARQNNRTIIPVCSYARKVLTQTDEYKDVL